MKFVGHKGSIEGVVVHRDVLYSASSDTTIRLWNPKVIFFIWLLISGKTGDKISVYKGHKGYITKMIVLDDLVFTAGFDSFIAMWNSKVTANNS